VVHFAEPAGLKGGDVLEVTGVAVNNTLAALGGTFVERVVAGDLHGEVAVSTAIVPA